MTSPVEHRTVHPTEPLAEPTTEVPPEGLAEVPPEGLAAFLATRDLDRLVEVRGRLGEPSAETDAQARQAISAWSDRQAVANLLMYPELIPAELRVAAVIRGLSDPSDGYLRLAAAVGTGEIADNTSDAAPDGGTRAGEQRRLLDAMLDLIATDTGPAAIRAAGTLPALARSGDLADLVVLLRHPDPAVRHNVVVALIKLLGNGSIAELLADRSVSADDATAAASNLVADGVDVAAPASELRMLSLLPYLPDLDDWEDRGRRSPREPAAGA